MKTCKNCIYSRKIIPRNTNCPSEFVCSLSDEDFHDCISNDMWRFSSKVLDQAMEDDAKQASIPYSYTENDANTGIQEFDKKFADLIVFNDQPQRQLKSSDVHEDV